MDGRLMSDRNIKMTIFFCSTSLDQRELERGLGRHNGEIKTIPLPCSGKVDTLYLTKAFESGADGVAVLTCKQGECRYLEGNLRARKRVEAIDTLLEEIGLGRGRMAIIQLGDGGIKQVLNELNDFRRRIESSPREFYIEDESELDKE